MKEAAYYKTNIDNSVKCLLCPNNCILAPGESGRCITRKNINGTLISENYGKTIAFSMDPIEKKPLYHFFPSSKILSIGPKGCNLSCGFCQNHTISQKKAIPSTLAPMDLIIAAKENDSIGIAYTYTEPFIWFEYLKEIMPMA